MKIHKKTPLKGMNEFLNHKRNKIRCIKIQYTATKEDKRFIDGMKEIKERETETERDRERQRETERERGR